MRHTYSYANRELLIVQNIVVGDTLTVFNSEGLEFTLMAANNSGALFFSVEAAGLAHSIDLIRRLLGDGYRDWIVESYGPGAISTRGNWPQLDRENPDRLTRLTSCAMKLLEVYGNPVGGAFTRAKPIYDSLGAEVRQIMAMLLKTGKSTKAAASIVKLYAPGLQPLCEMYGEAGLMTMLQDLQLGVCSRGSIAEHQEEVSVAS